MRSCVVYKVVGSLRLDWRSVVAGSVGLRKNIQRIWQQERQGGCAEAGRLVTHRDAAPGLPRRTWTADATRVGAQLSDHQQRFDEGDESTEGAVSRLGHSLCWHTGLCCARSRGMVGQAPPSRGAAPSGVALSTAGWTAGLAARGATRVVSREPEI